MLSELLFNLRHHTAIMVIWLLLAAAIPVVLTRLPTKSGQPPRPWGRSLPFGLPLSALAVGGLLMLMTRDDSVWRDAYVFTAAGEQRLAVLSQKVRAKGADECQVRVWELGGGTRVGGHSHSYGSGCEVVHRDGRWLWLKGLRKTGFSTTELDPLLLDLWSAEVVTTMAEELGDPPEGTTQVLGGVGGQLRVRRQDGSEVLVPEHLHDEDEMSTASALAGEALRDESLHRARSYGSCGCVACPPLILSNSASFGDGEWRLSVGSWAASVEALLGSNTPPVAVMSVRARCLLLGSGGGAVWLDADAGDTEPLTLE